MATAMTTDDSGALVERVQELQTLLDRADGSQTRALAEELVSTIVQMYGSGLERILEGILASGPEGARIAEGLAEDPLIATLLLIHDLHPVPLERRVQVALDSVRPYMDSHGGNVELLSLVMAPAWFELDGVSESPEGSLTAVAIAGSELVVANVDGTLLAYRDACAKCGSALHQGVLAEGALRCPQCERSYFLPRAGRSMDDERLQLEPVPLLREQGRVKVALSG